MIAVGIQMSSLDNHRSIRSIDHQRNQVFVVVLVQSFVVLQPLCLLSLVLVAVVVIQLDLVSQCSELQVVAVIVQDHFAQRERIDLILRFALLVPFDLDLHLIVVHLFDQVILHSVLLVVVQLVMLLIDLVNPIQEALSFALLDLVQLVQELTVVVMR